MKNKLLSIIFIILITMFAFSSCGIINLGNANTSTESNKKTDTEEKGKIVAVTRVELSQTNMTLIEGKQAKLIATVYPSTATDKTVEWESSNPKVATVKNGLVEAKQCGIVVIYAFTSNGVEASCTINVLPSEDDSSNIENPSEPENPIEPDNPVVPDEPTEPENPSEPENPIEPDNPVVPDEPTEPENPTEPEEPTEPEDPTEPEEHVHTEEILPAVAPTCTETGLTEGKKCSECGEILIAQEVVGTLGHDYVENEAKEPTCTEIGWNEYQTCSRCEYTTYEEISALGHDMQFAETVKPTCVANGYDIYDCSRCERTEHNNITSPSNSFDAHSYETIGVAPTCTSAGYSDEICSLCGCSAGNREILDALGHDYVENEAKTPTCTDIGWDTYQTCSRCDYTTYEEVPQLGHSYNGNYVCTRCGGDCPVSQGLEFTLDTATDTYIVSGMGTCADTDIVIPYTYEGKLVTGIEGSAFASKTSITSVTIPNSIASVGYRAFDGCTSLEFNEYGNAYYLGNNDNPYIVLIKASDKAITSCTINENAKILMSYAFSDCKALEEINFNAISMYDLDESNTAFKNVGQEGGGITLNIGNSVTKIPAYLLYIDRTSYLPNVTSIVFEENSECESIGNYAFYLCDSLENITLPNSITSIGDSAFRGCSSLSSIEIPNAVKTIGNSAFYLCDKLTSITVGKGVTSIGSEAFYSSDNIAYVNYLGTIEEWNNISFADCYANPLCYAKKLYISDELLSELVIKDTVTKINSYVFYNCTSLTSITIPESVTNIGSYAFYGCAGLEEINFNAVAMDDTYSNYTFDFAGNSSDGITVNVGKNVTKIPSCLFYSESTSFSPKITSVVFDENSVCESLGASAFNGCTNLTSITLPSSITSLGVSAFNGCTGLTSITIPNGVTSIGARLFSGCSSLTSIEIPNSVTTIGSSALSGCSKLVSLTIPFVGGNASATTASSSTLFGYIFGTASYTNGVETEQYYSSTGSATYYIPSTLKNVTINGKSILYGAFYACSNLKSITLAKDITKIESLSFFGCSLTSANYLGDIEGWCNITFGHSYNSNPVIGATESFLMNGEALTNLVIPRTITKINSYAFKGLTSIKSIAFSDGLTNIGVYAFAGCTGLTSITFPNSLKNIGVSAFEDCTSLTNVTIPTGTTIGTNAFYNCSSNLQIDYSTNE